MEEHLLLYSTNTWLSYAIAERFYKSVHWVWCSPFFRQDSKLSITSMPPSAIPGEIYDRLYDDVASGDKHSAWIEKNRVGLLKGAFAKKKEGIITNRAEKEIISMIHVADIQSFRPLLYIIPFSKVARSVKEVPVEQRAHPMSIEYRIKKLPRFAFHALELRMT
jgi:hypothetical protein